MSRRLLAAAVAALIGMTLAIVPTGMGTPAAAAPTSPPDAVQRFGSCLSAGGQGHLLLMLDTSPSLRTTDPTDQRVAAATYLLRELTSFVSKSGAHLDVAVAGFADRYRQTLGWTALSDNTTGQVLNAVAAYRTQKSGFETDYWSALNGARAALAAHAADADCTALVWFSDGMYDLAKRDGSAEEGTYGTTKPYGPGVELTSDEAADQVQRAGTTDLCRKGGVADALRVQGVTTLAIGLQGGQPPGAFDLMRGIATGTKVGGSACGARIASHTGDFVLAQNIGGLFFAFDQLTDPNHAPTSQTTPMCQGTVCPQGAHQFVLDPSISSVRILGGTDLANFYAVLQSPDGTRTRVVPGRSILASTSAYDVRGSWASGSVFTLALTRKRDQGWTGAWQLAFVDPASTGKGTARSNIRLYGDLQPAWLNHSTAPLTSGDSASLQLGLARTNKTHVAPGDLKGAVTVDAELAYADGTVVPIASNLHAQQLSSPVLLSLAGAPTGKARVHLSLTLTTAPAGNVPGTTLEAQVVDYPVRVTPPPNYPRLPDRVAFGTGDSMQPVTADLLLGGPGCAWLQSEESTTLPDGVTAAPVTADASNPSSCSAGKLKLTLTPDHVGSGLVSGLLHVMTRSDQAAGKPMPVTVRYSYEMQRPLNEKVLWLTLVALMLLGLLIPLLILLTVKWATSKIPGSTLTTLTVAGQVSGGSSFLNGWRPDSTELQPRALETTSRRHVELTPRTTLRAKANLLKLTEAGYVVVQDAPFVCSGGSKLPLAVQDQWVAVLDPANPHHGPVEVVFLMATGARRLDELVSDARAKISGAVAELRRGLGTAPAAPSGGHDEWGTAVSAAPSPSSPQTGVDTW